MRNLKIKISLVGFGCVGMTIATAFVVQGIEVIGFDLNETKIKLYQSGVDPAMEVGDKDIQNTTVYFTSEEKDLRKAKFHIAAVPTPINTDHTLDLTK